MGTRALKFGGIGMIPIRRQFAERLRGMSYRTNGAVLVPGYLWSLQIELQPTRCTEICLRRFALEAELYDQIEKDME